MGAITERIIDILRDGGFDAVYPSVKQGECREPYIVVKESGAVKAMNVSSERPIYTLMYYVPSERYAELEGMGNSIRETMKKVHPLVMYLGNETESFYDDTVKAHMKSVQYQGCRKIENW